MKFEHVLEYRGREDKTSSQGKNYSTLKLEDETGNQIPFYMSHDKVLATPLESLKKGHSYNMLLNYYMNPFDKVFRMDLENILEDVTETSGDKV